MKILSIDTETTGLDPTNCSVLEFGAVIFDPSPVIQGGDPALRRWQTFECIIKHQRVQGEPYALGLNAEILNEIAGEKETYRPIWDVTTFITNFRGFLLDNQPEDEKFTITGKNYDAFDRGFLDRVPGWRQRILPLCERRTLDLGSLCFDPADGKVVGLKECLAKLGIIEDVSHRALDDALQVATGVSRFFAE